MLFFDGIFLKKVLTRGTFTVIIFTCKSAFAERYRSGHNEAVLKTVCPRGRVGSNPTLSALKKLALS